MGNQAALSESSRRNLDLTGALQHAVERFVAANPKSIERHQQAKASLPGGNTRSILHFDPAPLTITRGDGCFVEDLDGHRYTDFLGEYSAGLYGHSNKVIAERIKETLANGTVLGGPNQYEAKLADVIVERFPAIDRVRFCNSGSEANLMALAVARAVTGRDTFLGFKGAYHGGFLMLDGHHGDLNVPHKIVCADYNDLDSVKAVVSEHGSDLAAIILEPMIGGGGCIPADQDFLEGLREIATETGALLIFDEVITSRLSPGGLQAKTGVHPDMTTLGKYIGGGMTVGAFGGRADIMDRFDPANADAFFHAGTFNNNVLTMAAGHAGLTEVLCPRANHYLNASGDDLRRRLNAMFKGAGLRAQVTGQGSIMTIHFTPDAIRKPADIGDGRPELKRLFHLDMLHRGQYIAPRGMIALSLPMAHRELDGLAQAVCGFVREYEPLLRDLGILADGPGVCPKH